MWSHDTNKSIKDQISFYLTGMSVPSPLDLVKNKLDFEILLQNRNACKIKNKKKYLQLISNKVYLPVAKPR